MPTQDTDASTISAVERSLADTRASRVLPARDMRREAQATLGIVAAEPAVLAGSRSPVVWTVTARATYLALLRAFGDVTSAARVADRLDAAAAGIDAQAEGVPGPIPFTYMAPVAGLPSTLIYEIVTWQKAGDVIAILHILALAQPETNP